MGETMERVSDERELNAALGTGRWINRTKVRKMFQDLEAALAEEKRKREKLQWAFNEQGDQLREAERRALDAERKREAAEEVAERRLVRNHRLAAWERESADKIEALEQRLAEAEARLKPSGEFERLLREYGNACASTTLALDGGLDIGVADAEERRTSQALHDHEAALQDRVKRAEAELRELRQAVVDIDDNRGFGGWWPHELIQRARAALQEPAE